MVLQIPWPHLFSKVTIEANSCRHVNCSCAGNGMDSRNKGLKYLFIIQGYGPPLFGLYPNGLFTIGLFMIGLLPFGLPMMFGLSLFGLF